MRGERKLEAVENEKGYHRIERSYGSFSRSFTLPDTIHPENGEGQFQGWSSYRDPAEERDGEAPSDQS